MDENIEILTAEDEKVYEEVCRESVGDYEIIIEKADVEVYYKNEAPCRKFDAKVYRARTKGPKKLCNVSDLLIQGASTEEEIVDILRTNAKSGIEAAQRM